jgi:pimeloyl-ACP methyl ester carboxylesterase
MDLEVTLRPPRRRLLLKESRALVDLATLPLGFVGPRRSAGTDRPVLVLPGFGAGELAMRPLRRYLQRHGVNAEDWGLGTNRAGLDIPHTLADLSPGWSPRPLARYRREGGVAFLVDRMVKRVRQRAEESGDAVALVGWSLGGTIAREVARDLPDAVSRVITLGSPFIGGPKYTAAGRSLRERGLDVDWIEQQVRLREQRPVTVPITAVVSPTDAVVDYAAAFDHFSERVEHVELDVAHLGMGVNRKVWKIVLERLV